MPINKYNGVPWVAGVEAGAAGAWIDTTTQSGLSEDNSNNTYVIFNRIDLTSGTVTKLRIWNVSGATSTGIKAALYTMNGTTATRVSSVGTASSGSGANAFTEITIPDYSATAGTFFLGWICETSNDFRWGYKTGPSENVRYVTGQSYSSGPPASATVNGLELQYLVGAFIE
jgi:hypothetical protein